MSFMKGDWLVLDLGQYFKIYIFLCMCNNIIILAFKYKSQCVIFRAIMAMNSRAVAISPVRFCRLLGPFISNLPCVYITLPLVRHET